MRKNQKLLSFFAALLLARPICAHEVLKELCFVNEMTPTSDVLIKKLPRRAPARIPQLPTCYSGEAAITFISDGDDYVIPYYVSDATGNVVMAGIVDFDPANPGIVDISALSAGTYSITITCGVEYTASFDVADFEY